MDLPDLDITDHRSVEAALAECQPDVVVNAAAYTAVDDAEAAEELATAVNGTAPGVLATAVSGRPGVRLVHISTDYVFPGTAATPYAEDAEPGPESAYGRSKLIGERAVLTALPGRSFVVRTAWLYGEHGTNFVKTMLRLESERDEVAVVTDQIGQPTWSRDLAGQIRLMIDRDAPAGIFHGTNSGAVSWFGFTQEIFRLAGADPARVRPTTSDAFPRPAPRPSYSVLGHDRWQAVGLPPMRPWDEALAEALPRLR
jgi:dTDP-4-dehydrorhamnose reductase